MYLIFKTVKYVVLYFRFFLTWNFYFIDADVKREGNRLRKCTGPDSNPNPPCHDHSHWPQEHCSKCVLKSALVWIYEICFWEIIPVIFTWTQQLHIHKHPQQLRSCAYLHSLIIGQRSVLPSRPSDFVRVCVCVWKDWSVIPKGSGPNRCS